MSRNHPLWTLTAILITTLSASAANACPSVIRALKTTHLGGETICQVADRYTTVRAQLTAEGGSPDRIANAIAPRFIKLDFWEKVRTAKNFEPWTVYDPAPMTWGKWERGREAVDDAARRNYIFGKTPVLSLKWALGLHGIDMKGLLEDAGHFRTDDVIGAAVERSKSVPTDQIESLRKNKYRTAAGEPLVSWTQTSCYEDVDAAFRNAHPKPTLDDQIEAVTGTPPKSFRDSAGVDRQCGFFVYGPRAEIRSQLTQWVKNVNFRSHAAYTTHSADPLLTAARAQKWFISIHPFSDGNGRTSRFAMDYVIESAGLPAPIITDMDLDLLSTESEWADEIGRGILRTLKILENCAGETTPSPGCKTISTEAPVVPSTPVIE
jgi:hypothetical protein